MPLFILEHGETEAVGKDLHALQQYEPCFSDFHGLHVSDLILSSRDPRKSRREEIDKERRGVLECGGDRPLSLSRPLFLRVT